MDKTLDLKRKQFSKALASLKKSLEEEKNDLVRDSAIKRFEYSYELCWKTVKIFLSDRFGEDVFSPKECFRALRKNKLISDEDTELLLRMTDDRNKIIHTYNESFSEELYEDIAQAYYQIIKKIYKILN